MERIGVVTGLAAEQACLERLHATGLSVACAGADEGRAAAAAERLAREGCAGLVSFGLCGALADAVRPGSLILADRVIDDGGVCIETDAVWRHRLDLALADLNPTVAMILGRSAAVLDPEHKRRLYGLSGAVAVDMESAAVARVAGRCGVPCVVVRAVADGADTAVPAAAAAAIGADGRPRLAPILRHLALRPGVLPAFIRLGRDAGRGMASLRRVAALAGRSGFQFRF